MISPTPLLGIAIVIIILGGICIKLKCICSRNTNNYDDISDI
jgi:hypothetical protein